MLFMEAFTRSSGIHVGDQHFRNAIAEGLHRGFQLRLHVHRDLRLLEKYIIEDHPRQVAGARNLTSLPANADMGLGLGRRFLNRAE
jgi:hypothetical protein